MKTRRMTHASSLLLALLTFPGSASAQSKSANEVAASLNLVSDRIWRGLSQTEGGPALIGEAKFNHKDGPFVGLVVTNFSSDRDGDAGLALTPFFGFNRNLGRINFDAGFLHREHVGVPGRNFDEITASIGYKAGPISVRPGIFYAVDHYLPGNPVYAYVDGRAKLGAVGKVPVTLSAHLGTFEARGSANDYSNWRLGLSAPVRGVTLSANLSDADIDAARSELEGARHGGTRFAVSAFLLF